MVRHATQAFLRTCPHPRFLGGLTGGSPPPGPEGQVALPACGTWWSPGVWSCSAGGASEGRWLCLSLPHSPGPVPQSLKSSDVRGSCPQGPLGPLTAEVQSGNRSPAPHRPGDHSPLSRARLGCSSESSFFSLTRRRPRNPPLDARRRQHPLGPHRTLHPPGGVFGKLAPPTVKSNGRRSRARRRTDHLLSFLSQSRKNTGRNAARDSASRPTPAGPSLRSRLSSGGTCSQLWLCP